MVQTVSDGGGKQPYVPGSLGNKRDPRRWKTPATVQKLGKYVNNSVNAALDDKTPGGVTNVAKSVVAASKFNKGALGRSHAPALSNFRMKGVQSGIPDLHKGSFRMKGVQSGIPDLYGKDPKKNAILRRMAK